MIIEAVRLIAAVLGYGMLGACALATAVAGAEEFNHWRHGRRRA